GTIVTDLSSTTPPREASRPAAKVLLPAPLPAPIHGRISVTRTNADLTRTRMKRTVGLVAAITMVFVASSRADTTIDSVNRYAWGANIGFTDWRPSTTDGVNIGDNFCAGFIYAANVGW